MGVGDHSETKEAQVGERTVAALKAEHREASMRRFQALPLVERLRMALEMVKRRSDEPLERE